MQRENSINKFICLLCRNIQFNMFSKWIDLLFKFFDICGFHTELFCLNKKTSVKIFVLHNLWVFTLTIFILLASSQPIILTEALAYSVNYLLQNVNGMFTYWVIIVESYFQRKNQQKFWQIYKQVYHYRKVGRSFLRTFSIKFAHFFIVITIIQMYFVLYFVSVNGNQFIFFRIAYFCYVAMYQCRSFYYILYLELIKYELMRIKCEVKQITIGRNDYKREKSLEIHIKNINRYYQLIYALTDRINDTFGWSNFTTVIYCFHLPLTDFNWALKTMYKQSNEYCTGNQHSFFSPKLCHLLSIYHLDDIVVFIIWMMHLFLIIFYIFKNATDCRIMVRLNWFLLDK